LCVQVEVIGSKMVGKYPTSSKNIGKTYNKLKGKSQERGESSIVKKTGTNGDRKARGDWYTLTNLFCLLGLKRLGSCHRAQLYHFFSHGIEDCK
jgi:hypothetical protein